MRKISFWWLVIIVLLPHLAQAQSPTELLNFDPVPDDTSVQFLAAIFGSVGGVLHGTGSQIMAVMFKVFNAGVLALGGVIVTYTLFTSTLNTAQDGEVMGKKWSSIWIPVRSALGVALLLPQTTGYSFIQVLVMWLVIQGVGLADSIWNAALIYVKNGGVVIQNTSQPTAGGGRSNKIKDVFYTQVCMYGVQRILQNNYDRAPSANKPPYPPVLASTIDISALPGASLEGDMAVPRLPMDDYPDYGTLNAICGRLQWTAQPEGTETVYGSQTTLATGARSVALQQILLNMADPAKRIVDNEFGPVANKVKVIGSCPSPGNDCGFGLAAWKGGSLLQGEVMPSLFADYTAIISPALSMAKHQFNRDWVNDAQAKGWLLAGSFYYKLAKLKAKENFLIDSNMPVVSGKLALASDTNARGTLKNECELSSSPFKRLDPDTSTASEAAAGNEDGKTNCKKLIDLLTSENLQQFVDDSMDNYTLPNQQSSVSIKGAGKWPGWMKQIPMIGQILAIDDAFRKLKKAQDTGDNPILIAADLGNSLLEVVTYMWLGGLLFGVGAGVVGAIPSVTISNGFVATAVWIVPFLTVVMTMLFTAGGILSYYIPLMPYIIYTFGGLGWLIGVIEAMVAAPIVAIGVLHPDGQHDVMGKADQAAMLLLNVFLRPGMMIIGFIGAIALSYVGIWLVNAGFSRIDDVMDPGGRLSKIWWLVFTPIIYAMLCIQIMSKAFDLIHILPDKVLRWLSGGMAESLGAETAGQAQSMRGMIGQTAGQMGGGIAQSHAARANQSNQKAQQTVDAKSKQKGDNADPNLKVTPKGTGQGETGLQDAGKTGEGGSNIIGR